MLFSAAKKRHFFKKNTVLLPLLIFFPLISSCSFRQSSFRTENLLGTVCTVNLFDSDSKKNFDEIFDFLKKIDGECNSHSEKSKITQINNAAGLFPVEVSDELFEILETAVKIAEITGGKFDPSVGSLVSLWGINTEDEHIPDIKEIEDAKKKVDFRKIKLDKSKKTVYLSECGMKLDVGGIAKGYAADGVSKICRKNKIKRAVIDLGGNVYVLGRKKNGMDWKIGIKNPKDTSSPFASVLIKEGSVVTSGIYERFFEKDGIIYHHIFECDTGYPVQNDLLSVSVICSSSFLADALSTSFFALGLEKSIELMKNPFFTDFKKDSGVIFVKKDGTVFVTDGISENIEILSDDFVLCGLQSSEK